MKRKKDITSGQDVKPTKNKTRKTIEFLGAFLLAWLWLLTVLFVFQRHLQYHPDTSQPLAPERYGLSGVDVVQFDTADHITLTSWYIPAAKQDAPTVMLFHGNAGHIANRSIKAKYYADKGIGILLVGYRGYGGNDGTPTEEGFYKDGEAAWAFLTEDKKIPENKIIVYGESLGSGVATEIMQRHDAAALVLEAPFVSAASVAKYIYPFVLVDLLLKDRYDNISKIKNINGPVLILSGTEDDVLPYWQGTDLYTAASDPKAFAGIEGGKHVDLYDFEETGQALMQFFSTHKIFTP